MLNYYLAVDLGGTSAKCAVIQDEKIIKQFRVATKIGEVLENIKHSLDKEITDFKITSADFKFIAFTICGLIDYEKGISIWSGNLQWDNYPVVKNIKKIFNNEIVFILNDSKAATYGEYIKGLNSEMNNVLFYTIGTGIGGGIILNKKLYFGNNTKLASEPGHSGGFQDLYKCNCGLPGCVEGLSSATGIEKELNKEFNYFQNRLKISKDRIEIKDIAGLFKEQDSKTFEIFKKCLNPLINHIAVSIHLMDFDTVVIGGGPSALGKDLIELIRSELKVRLLPPFYQKLDLRLAKLKNKAGIWGIYYYAKGLISG